MMRVEAQLLEKLKADPEAEFNLIIGVKEDPAESASRLSAMGVEVRRIFSLTKTVAIRGKAAACLALANEPWVKSIEEDKKVHTMKGKGA